MENRVAQVEIVVYKAVDNRIFFLLLKRVPQKGGFWQPITGGARENESFVDAAKRELFEETQIKDYRAFLNDVYYFEFDSEEYGRVKEYVFGVEVDQNTKVKLSREHSEKKWCTLEEALNLLKYDTNKEAFKKVIDRIKITKK